MLATGQEERSPENELSPEAFSEYLAQLCASPEGARSRFAVLVIHFDRSDRGSAIAGLARGQAALAQLRTRLSGALRASDRFAIVGPNEAVAILPGVNSDTIVGLAGTRILKEIDAPMTMGSRSVLMRGAIGCAFFPDQSTDADELVAAADETAMRARTLPSRVDICRTVGRSEQHHELVAELRHAIANNELEVWFQPQIDCHRRECLAAEALIRWPRPHGKQPVHAGLIAELAESNGLMPPLTDFVVNTALRHLRTLDKQGIELSVGINLSASVLSDPELPDRIAQALAIWGIPAARTTLEVTESSLMHDFEGALLVMNRLKQLGARLSIDDFGTGYSSMSYLRRMPLDELKIDQVFIRNILKNPSDIQITRSVIDLSHHFGLEAVAEGVESREVMDLLIGFGCDLLQGFYFSKPVPITELIRWWPSRVATLPTPA